MQLGPWRCGDSCVGWMRLGVGRVSGDQKDLLWSLCKILYTLILCFFLFFVFTSQKGCIREYLCTAGVGLSIRDTEMLGDG